MKDTIIYNPSREVSKIDTYFPGQNKQVDSMKIEESDSYLAGDKVTLYLENGEISMHQPMYSGLYMIAGIILFWIFVIYLIYKLFLYIRQIKKNTDKIVEALNKN